MTDENLKIKKAMVIDDHDPIRKAMKRVLSKMGVQNIIECFDGEMAIKELAKNQDVDLILCDIFMRKIDGFQVLSFVRSRSIKADIPFIVVTGEASKHDIVKANDLGADDYIIKPFQAEAMSQKIASIVHRFQNPSRQIHLLREVENQLVAKKFDQAFGIVKEALEIDPESLRARHSLAVIQYSQGNLAEAISTLEESIKISDSYYRNHATLANIYMKQKRIPEAISCLSKELEFNPKQPSRQNLLAKLLMTQGDALGAIEHYRDSLKENSKDYEALMGIGKAFAHNDDVEKSLYYFKRTRRHFFQKTEPLEAIVKLCLKEEIPRKAELALIDEIRQHPERHDSYPLLARFYINEGLMDKALQVIDELAKISPENPETFKIKAIINMKQNQFEAAIELWEQALKHGTDFDSLLALANCLQKQKQIKKSIQVLHQAKQHEPKNAKCTFMLGQAYRKTKQYRKAFFLFETARKQGGNQEKCAKNILNCRQNISLSRSQ